MLVEHVGNQSVHDIEVGEVARMDMDGPTLRPDLGLQLVEHVHTPGHEEHVRPSAGEQPGGGGADP